MIIRKMIVASLEVQIQRHRTFTLRTQQAIFTGIEVLENGPCSLPVVVAQSD